VTKVIIGIHGLANKPPEGQLKEWWHSSLLEGLEKNRGLAAPLFEFRMVYWADLLYKYPLHNEANYTFDKLYNDEPYVAAETNALKPDKDGFSDRVRAGVFDLIGDSVDALKEHFGMDALADWLIGQLVKDLHFYYDQDRRIADKSGAEDLARIVLRRTLLNELNQLKGKSAMLIAHSMGSIIAYDALRDLGRDDPDFQLSHLVTIGSPLGLPHVKAKILKEREYDAKVRRPSVVRQGWVNFADRKDPVAADVHLSDDYEANAFGIKVKDDLVINDYRSPGKERKSNHHKSYGYLRTPELSRRVAEFLAS
jgi:hypothetical protein